MTKTRNGTVRAALPDELSSYMDTLGRSELRPVLQVMSDQVDLRGWDGAVAAMGTALRATGRIDAASVAMAAASEDSVAVAHDDPVDLRVYDMAIGRAV